MNAAVEWLEEGFNATHKAYVEPGIPRAVIAKAYTRRFRQVLATVTAGMFTLKKDHERADAEDRCTTCRDAHELIIIE